MSGALRVTVERRGHLACIRTEGYINNEGGEEVARAAYQLLDDGVRHLILDLSGSRIINSIGISILIEVLERLLASQGRLVFCGLTPTIEKTFQIMGLSQYATLLPTADEAWAALEAGG
jgi:anti-sigma B factor antagonist